jgi:hypothetical protein
VEAVRTQAELVGLVAAGLARPGQDTAAEVRAVEQEQPPVARAEIHAPDMSRL